MSVLPITHEDQPRCIYGLRVDAHSVDSPHFIVLLTMELIFISIGYGSIMNINSHMFQTSPVDSALYF
jgi:predicted neutral ceramidase superfamily lipid hydrolase